MLFVIGLIAAFFLMSGPSHAFRRADLDKLLPEQRNCSLHYWPLWLQSASWWAASVS
jgi:hypothetical protein